MRDATQAISFETARRRPSSGRRQGSSATARRRLVRRVARAAARAPLSPATPLAGQSGTPTPCPADADSRVGARAMPEEASVAHAPPRSRAGTGFPSRLPVLPRAGAAPPAPRHGATRWAGPGAGGPARPGGGAMHQGCVGSCPCLPHPAHVSHRRRPAMYASRYPPGGSPCDSDPSPQDVPI